MSHIEKLIQRFINNPERIRYRDLEKVLRYLGFLKLETKGSHMKFKHKKLTYDLIIPVHNNECKEFYKKQVYKQIKILL